MKFIYVEDNDVVNYLRLNNYQELPKQGKFYVFINDKRISFSDAMRKKMIYTDKFFV